MAVSTRVRFVYDDDHQFEECNGESRPLTEEEYTKNTYRACPDHPRAGSQVIQGLPQIQGCAVCQRTDYVDVPYEEYLSYYGNPDRHVYLGCIVQVRCSHCDHWGEKSAIFGIDFMDDSPELYAIKVGEWMHAEVAAQLPGYAGEIAREFQRFIERIV